MELAFLETEGEALAFFMAATYYVGVMFHIQSRYLNLLKQKNAGKKKRKQNVGKLKRRGLSLLLVGPVIHFILYWIFFDVFLTDRGNTPEWRNQYLMWIGITFIGFVLGLLFNFYLKGTSTLPTQDGQVTGLP
jgi:Na+-driven multidrug efflux pump